MAVSFRGSTGAAVQMHGVAFATQKTVPELTNFGGHQLAPLLGLGYGYTMKTGKSTLLPPCLPSQMPSQTLARRLPAPALVSSVPLC